MSDIESNPENNPQANQQAISQAAPLVIPDRLSTDIRSPYYDEAILSKEIGIRFNGVERTNIEEYCISESWVRIPSGKSRDRKGQPLLLKLKGTVEPYFKD